MSGDETLARVRAALDDRAKYWAHPDYEQETTEGAFSWAEVRALCEAVETLTGERDGLSRDYGKLLAESNAYETALAAERARADRLQAQLDAMRPTPAILPDLEDTP